MIPVDTNTADPQETEVALMLGALGNETRLRIFRMLVQAGRKGLNVGEVQSRLQAPASTLAHHLGALRQSGLIAQTKQGRSIICTANYQAMDGLISYLTDACCAGDVAD